MLPNQTALNVQLKEPNVTCWVLFLDHQILMLEIGWLGQKKTLKMIIIHLKLVPCGEYLQLSKQHECPLLVYPKLWSAQFTPAIALWPCLMVKIQHALNYKETGRSYFTCKLTVEVFMFPPPKVYWLGSFYLKRLWSDRWKYCLVSFPCGMVPRTSFIKSMFISYIRQVTSRPSQGAD